MHDTSPPATVTVTLEDAEAHLPALVERAAAGEEIVIEESGKPRARLVAAQAAPAGQRRLGGFLRGQIRIGDDFDDPLPDDIIRVFSGEGH